MHSCNKEISQGERFAFGRNWRNFNTILNEERVIEAENSMKKMLEEDNFAGKMFLDIGAGSGLHSLVARRLGAKVVSFDYDPHSTTCTNELKRRYFPDDSNWTIKTGSVLDKAYLKGLGEFDIVYAWGVMHHTGNMWLSLENASILVKTGGKLFVSIYNDQGRKSRWWRRIKKIYNSLPEIVRIPYIVMFMVPVELFHNILKLPRCIRAVREYQKNRGMSIWNDWVDWVGGYPFEVARPEEIFEFYRNMGFSLFKLKTVGGYWGCNEFVFQKKALSS